MPALPDGEPAPADGRLPEPLDWSRPLRAYVHVPFCSARCGYCDFNTYTTGELGGFAMSDYVEALLREIELAAGVVATKPLSSVFLGGGTPSLLPAASLNTVLEALRGQFGLEPGAEITLEANPENVNAQTLDAWLEAGVTRISIGMQSADPGTLAVLERVHTPGAAVAAANLARRRGFEHTSLDLIYGVPGQSKASWESTVGAALDANPDHISAYALGVEPGTALHRRVRQGEVAAPDPDAAAAQYELADSLLSQRGLNWYEISNWARPGGACDHNLGYWRGDNWWGFGPGAHSHVDGVRWWNVKRPATYRSMLVAERSPAAGRELLDDEQRRVEEVMLATRLASGIDPGDFDAAAIQRLLDDALLERTNGARLHLTLRGRMLADAVVRVLLGWD